MGIQEGVEKVVKVKNEELLLFFCWDLFSAICINLMYMIVFKGGRAYRG